MATIVQAAVYLKVNKNTLLTFIYAKTYILSYNRLSSLYSADDRYDKKTEIFLNNFISNCNLTIVHLVTTLYIS